MSDINEQIPTETEQDAIVREQSEELSVEELEDAAGGGELQQDEFASTNGICGNAYKCTSAS